jgi:vitamin B12 transporter
MNQTIQQSLVAVLLLSSSLSAAEHLQDITVTSATKSTQKIKETTANIDVITAEEIEERHYTTVVQALNSLAGVNFTSNGGLGATTSLYLRGMASKRVLVLINGVRQNDPTGLSGADFSNLMVTDIEQIEVIKGAQSGIWGADAAAGVINIITKSASKGMHYHFSQEFGSFETSKTNMGTSYRGDAFYLKLDHSQLSTDGFSAQVPSGGKVEDYEDDAYSNQSTSLELGFDIDKKNKIELSHTTVRADNEFDGGAYTDTPEEQANNSDYNANSKSNFSKINYHHTDSFNEVDFYASKSKFSREYPAYFSSYDGEVVEYGMKSKIDYRAEDFVIWGGDYKKFKHKNSINRSYANRAIFLTNSNTFRKDGDSKTILTQSLRRDIYKAFDSKTTGKIGLKRIHKNIGGLITSINYGTAYNVPTINNLYDPYSGNPDITPESTKSWDISAEWRGVKISYFDTKIEDMIDYISIYDAEGNWMGGGYDNLQGESKIKGVELGYQTTIGEDFAIATSYTQLDAKNKKGEELARRPKESLKLAIDYYGVESLHLGLDGEFVGKRYSQDAKEGEQTGRYTTANLTANYQATPQITLYGRVDNITDKNYQTISGYSTSPRAIYMGINLAY